MGNDRAAEKLEDWYSLVVLKDTLDSPEVYRGRHEETLSDTVSDISFYNPVTLVMLRYG